jgi:predicted secreted protein
MKRDIRYWSVVLLAFALVGLLHSPSAWAKDLSTPFEYGVLGWSNDSSLWGFYEKGDYGCGMIYQPGIGYFVIDSVKNDFAYKFSKNVGEQHDESISKRTVERWERQSRKRVKVMGLSNNMGVVAYKKRKMVWIDVDSRFKQFGNKEISFDHLNHRYDVKLEDAYIDVQNTMSGKKSMFTLSIRKEGGPWKSLQADKKPWRTYIAYRILYVSVSPDSKKIAVLIEAVEHSLEGTKQSTFKGVTGLLPQSP